MLTPFMPALTMLILQVGSHAPTWAVSCLDSSFFLTGSKDGQFADGRGMAGRKVGSNLKPS